MDIGQAAQLLGVEVSMVRRLVHERRINFVKVGRLVRFKETDLLAFIEAGTVPAQPIRRAGR
jgi:excisionase family DNA binding protein